MAVHPLISNSPVIPVHVGGKAANLMRLAGHFLVPDGFVITADDILDQQGILEAFDSLDSPLVAVRSSSVHEDGGSASWAGQLETVLNIPRQQLMQSIQQCRASAVSDRAQAYALDHAAVAGEVAVIVQRMLEPNVSGVAFSRHPVTSEEAVVIEAVTGLADKLVGGNITPDTYIVRGSGVEESYLSTQQPLMSAEQLAQVVAQVRAIEQYLGYAVDIEWAIQDSQIYILQARPITTL